jgi:hypothetical protein
MNRAQTRLSATHCQDTRFGELEFFVSLRAPTGNDAADEAKWLQRVEASIPSLSAP